MADDKFKPSQLRELYDVLGHLSEEEQMALAELYADANCQRLIERFEKSSKLVAEYPENLEPFHSRMQDKELKALGTPTPIAEIKTTNDIASHLGGDRLHTVEGKPELSFHYVDREVFALRTTAMGGMRPPRRPMDLLLASRDGFPIVGELKIGSDKPAFYALAQALMYAIELSSPAQRARLRHNYERFQGNIGLQKGTGPFLDIYLIAFNSPSTGAFRERSFQATRKISANLINAPEVNAVIRRIAYLEIVSENDVLTFEERFSTDRGRSP